MRTILLFSQPKAPLLNLLIHPLTLPITTFLKYDNKMINEELTKEFPHLSKSVGAAESDTKIVFINLDGK